MQVLPASLVLIMLVLVTSSTSVTNASHANNTPVCGVLVLACWSGFQQRHLCQVLYHVCQQVLLQGGNLTSGFHI